ncbi:MAG: aminoacyl-histidine dipeptidase [Chitinispirillaceae bacterium]|nr:aminoacyl-histidine dipeptidase [Chitinispirillaceae bacterium]
MSSAIQGLEPERLWEYFEELSAVPRCSKHEAAAGRYVLGVAKRLGLEALRDPKGNVIARKKCAPGRENAPMVALQSHLDMVCEKNKGTAHDFGRDPILLKRTGEYVSAEGTTLGADNGLGVATALALMENAAVRHGPLEFVFTVDEETGLTGAAALRSNDLKSRILINLDTEDEGVLYVGCAGGCDSIGTLAAAVEPLQAKHALYSLRVCGLRGGHSGIDIHLGRANAIKLLSRALSALAKSGAHGVRLCRLSGGNKRNAIPREAEALVALTAAQAVASVKAVAELERTFRDEYASADGGIAVSLTPYEGKRAGMKVFNKKAQERLLGLLHALPHGVIAMSFDIPELVETSTNLARVTMEKNRVVIETSQRSSVESRKREIVQAVSAVFALAGAKVAHTDGYPGWKPDLQSPILKIAKETYRRLFGKEAGVKAVHAGLECGIIGERFPGMDMVSLGPTLEMVHSPDERVHIGSVKKYWEFLLAILERI